ncbi:hypothetical protein Tco_0368336 [Tanacetum coccineum]
MRTRSQTRNHNRQQQAPPAVVEPFNLVEPFDNPPLVPMADNRTMAELLQLPTEGYEDAIVIPEINANFELKHATDGNVYRDNIQEYVSQAAAANFNQGNTNSRPLMVANQIRPPGQMYQPPTSQPPVYQAQPYQASAPQMQGVSKTDFENYVKANDAILRNMQNQGQVTPLLIRRKTLRVLLPEVVLFIKDLRNPTTHPPKVVERRTEVTKDTVFPTNNGITEDVQPPVVPVENQNPVYESVVAPVSAPMPNHKPSIPYPSRRNDEKHRENANEQKEKFYKIFKDMRSGYHQKDRKPSQNDKTEHGMEKTVQNQGQSPKMPKSESILKNTIECNLNPSDGPGKPNSIFMKTVKTKWALNHLQQPICVHLTKTVKTLKAQS